MNCTHAIFRLAPLLLIACVIGCSASTDSPQVTLEKAHIQKERGNFEEAIPLYDAAITLLPESTDAYYSRGDCYRQLGLFDQAVADFDDCLQLDPQSHGARNDKGICLAESGQFAAAVGVFTEVIRQDPADAQAYRNRALSLYHQQQFEAAIADYDQSLQRNADDPETWFQKGNAVRALSRLPEAVECYTEAINRAPNFAYAWMNRGVARYQLGERKEGLAELAHASELNGDIVVPGINWLDASAANGDAKNGDVHTVAKPVTPVVDAWSLVLAAAQEHLQSLDYTDIQQTSTFDAQQCAVLTATLDGRPVQVCLAAATTGRATIRVPAPGSDTAALLIMAPEAGAAKTEDVGVLHFDPAWQPDANSTPVLLDVLLP
ncbi:MAG: tetratricopeptide repeat protein [Planctomycetaceae bacterium]|nr:tetratricopeptide repeat protein [Planctomycetaceae bacterium]